MTFTNEDCVISCSNCNTPLVEVWVKEDGPEKSSLRVECGHCKDLSFIKNISGKFYVGSTEYVTINDIEISENDEGVKVSIIKTTKLKKYKNAR